MQNDKDSLYPDCMVEHCMGWFQLVCGLPGRLKMIGLVSLHSLHLFRSSWSFCIFKFNNLLSCIAFSLLLLFQHGPSLLTVDSQSQLTSLPNKKNRWLSIGFALAILLWHFPIPSFPSWEVNSSTHCNMSDGEKDFFLCCKRSFSDQPHNRCLRDNDVVL